MMRSGGGDEQEQEEEEEEDSAVPELIALSPPSAVREKASVPVTIITGFLGAGKSTLVSYVANREHGLKFAIIANEFGDSMDIEELVVKDGADGTVLEGNLFALRNGCICCTVKDDLVTTLEALLSQRNLYDYILIETTGLANPGPVASCLWLDEELESALKLDGIVTVVDAKNISPHLDAWENHEMSDRHHSEATVQLACADRIIINKCDLIGCDDLDRLKRRIRAINGIAQVACTQKSEVDLRWILNIQAFDPLVLESAMVSPDESCCSGGKCTVHRLDVSTLSVESSRMLSRRRLERWMGNLLWEEHSEGQMLYRIKGLMYLDEDSERRHVLQGVYDVFDISASTPWDVDESPRSKLVFIGINLNAQSLDSQMRLCEIDPS
jgi:G3E family GTPase